jgi:aminoglycoside phosphotransferase (APT) family kinase protein
MSTHHDLLTTILQQRGYLAAGETLHIERLGGGVSNDVLRVTTPRTRLVIKQSLPKLRVQMDWYADQERIWRERDYLQTVGAWLPGNVPAVLFADEANFVLAIEEITGATLWKSTLLAGHCDPHSARRAGALLAEIHSRSHAQPALAQQFQRKATRSEDSFEQLRIDPYWRTVARRHPDLAPAIDAIIAQMEAEALALVHGDYSPKNIFVRADGDLVILDAEVAHWGDPTFDVAFCLNHFLLKAIYHAPKGGAFVDEAELFWTAYRQAAPALAAGVATRLPGQLAALLLARIDGKSPVEYLVDQPEKQAAVRALARGALQRVDQLTLADLWADVRQGASDD